MSGDGRSRGGADAGVSRRRRVRCGSSWPQRVRRLFAAGLLGPVALAAATDSGRPRPNVLLIVIDDLGYGDLGCYGSTRHRAPHLDRLAAGGMRFTDFHTNGAVCSPTRAALMTGQYQQRSGIEAAIGFTLEEGVPLAQTMLAEMLAPPGYRSGVFGKWHLGHVTRFGPNDQGFHESVCSNNSPDYHSHISRDGNHDWWHNQQPHREPGYLTDLVTRHTRLEELGMRDRTLIFVTSDNGAYSWVGSNRPLRGQKAEMFEGGHRVPAIANWPGRIPAGTVSDATLMTMDLAPTVLALTGITAPQTLRFDGADLSGVWLRSERLPERTLFWRDDDERAVRRGSWKLIKTAQQTQLFDLQRDLGEEHDVAPTHPAKVRELEQALAAWERDVGPGARRSTGQAQPAGGTR